MNNFSLQKTFLEVRSNKVFEAFVIFIIIFSALVIGVKTYPISPAVLTVVSWMDLFITAFFLVEILIRFFGEERKLNFFKSGWNIFDSIIVLVSLVPIQEGEMALVGRLLRVFRVLRMVSIIPELRLLLNSLIRALPQLGYVLLLMFIIYYIYAAIGCTLFSYINPTLWADIATALLTLFRVMTFEDWTDVMYETMEVYPWSWAYYITFIFFTTFAFLNMIIGIVVNVLEQESAKARAQEVEPEISVSKETIETLTEQVALLTQLVDRLQSSDEIGSKKR